MDPKDTRGRILDAAESLFAEQGFERTSLREITTAADANLAAVNYHFGSKEELIRDVFARFFGPINRRRLELLDAAERKAEGQPVELEALLKAFLTPALETWRRDARGEAMVQLFSRITMEIDVTQSDLHAQLFGEVFARYFPAFRKTLPHLSPEELLWRFHFMVGAMAFGVLNHRRLCRVAPELVVSNEPSPPDDFLINYAVAGFSAPASAIVPTPTASADWTPRGDADDELLSPTIEEDRS